MVKIGKIPPFVGGIFLVFLIFLIFLRCGS